MTNELHAPGAARRFAPPGAGLACDRMLLTSARELRRVLQPLVVGHQTLLRCGGATPSGQALLGQQLRSVAEASRLVDALVHVAELETRARSPADGSFELAGAVLQTLRSQDAGIDARRGGPRAELAPAWVRGDRALLQDVVGLLLAELLHSTPVSSLVVESCAEDGRAGVDLHLSDAAIERLVAAGESRRAGADDAEPVAVVLARRTADWLGCALSLRHAAHALVGARILVPRAIAAGVPAPADVPVPRAHGGLRALVVDDDAAVRLATRLLLEAEGLDVQVASCGRDAIECAASESPDVIVADWHLGPGESGTDVIDDLRRHCGRRIPAVLLTGDVAEPDGRAGLQVLTKPFAADALLDAIARASAADPAGAPGITADRRAP